MAVGREHQAGERPPKEGRCWAAGRDPLRSVFLVSSEAGRKGREGQKEGKRFFQGPAEANLEGAKAQEGRVPTPTRQGWGSRRVPLVSRAKAAEAPLPSRAVWQGSVRAEGPRETVFPLRERKKALKSEAQERGRLKKASEDRGADAAKRVAKP